MNIKATIISTFAGLLLLTCSHANSNESAIETYLDKNARFHPVISELGLVVSQEAIASQVGADILEAGGNAIDAAVATGFALAVTLPRAGNLGGGGFMMFYCPGTSKYAVENALKKYGGWSCSYQFTKQGLYTWQF